MSFLFFGVHAHSQNTPAAQRNYVEDVLSFGDVEDDETFERSVENHAQEGTATKFKKAPKKWKKRRGGSVLGSFLMILGFCFLLGGIVSFFFFGALGWWVALISLGCFLFGFVSLMGAAFAWDSLEGLFVGIGSILIGVASLITWLLGVIIIGIIDLST